MRTIAISTHCCSRGGGEEGYTKSIPFLKEIFRNMAIFLRVPGVQRNSETGRGMCVLHPWEWNHDGFRPENRGAGPEGEMWYAGEHSWAHGVPVALSSLIKFAECE